MHRLLLLLAILPTTYLLAAEFRQVGTRSWQQEILGTLISTLLLHHTGKTLLHLLRHLSKNSEERDGQFKTISKYPSCRRLREGFPTQSSSTKVSCGWHLVEECDTPRKGPWALQSRGCCLEARQRISQSVSLDV